ncbi:acyl carrier protein [Magnetospirillum fulvum]|jgi:polyketide biosynthesis acyl carrier protein|uniref:Polyketide biosynthesis acyl carrier protein n=1 Tax=Magnetospirillum fulvum TaxID=1082 RepID=A0A1H6I2F5_MAGFU|nr:acyl carrier protein [Magnetospirillum fulvum]SEH40790.1 polyketide biosynthesis acyl carrier protein [Magnetospirillum fulvum]
MDSDQILDLLTAEIGEVVPDLAGRSFTRAESMAELGIDSIERSEILINTLEKIGLVLPLVQLHGPRNLGELADLIHAKLAAA